MARKPVWKVPTTVAFMLAPTADDSVRLELTRAPILSASRSPSRIAFDERYSEVSVPCLMWVARFETSASVRGSMPMIEVVRLRPAKRSTALDCTDGVSSPGTQVCSDAMVAIGFLIPGRRTSGVRPWNSAAA